VRVVSRWDGPLSDSVSQWIVDLQNGDAEAAQRLWDRYFAKLVSLARYRLWRIPQRSADEEDVAVSVFESLCRGASAGRFAALKDRQDLWWLLAAITKQKIVNHLRQCRAERCGKQVRCETEVGCDVRTGEPFDLDSVLDAEPTPELAVEVEDHWQMLLNRLRNRRLRAIARMRIEGYEIHQIAAKLRILPRAVQRKLHLIRGIWWEELER